MDIKTIPLSIEDKRHLRKTVVGGGIFGVIAAIFFTFIVGTMTSDVDRVGVYVVSGFGLFFFGIVAFIIGGAAIDLINGTKRLIIGPITRKETHKTKSRKSSTKTTYYLYFEDLKRAVDFKHYHSVKVGDVVELHYGAWSRQSFQVNLLNEAANAPKVEPKKQRHSNPRIADLALTIDDLRVLRNHRNKKIAMNAFLAVFFLIMTLGFSLGALVEWFFGIFILVFLGISVLSIRAIFRCFSKYAGDKKSGVKQVSLEKVIDLSVHTGRGTSHQITTGQGSYPVSQVLFQQLSIGDQVIVSSGSYSKWFIGLTTEHD